MSASNTKVAETTEDFAARALELLEQSYEYYSQPVRVVENRQQSETYYEYVKAA
ncbi:hypothetical protein J7382_12405 [Shimia sp. R11_0]|uniref:hypothetical protein n=1 Tax=Shimia sp. R11_0 TaxID=2821096 RepID=UPI001ADAF72A|nr:hypothetical protein [Shimia sp. R11_0]MBO9478339.1 hypothetical protein [Shimia sp. R11_0]